MAPKTHSPRAHHTTPAAPAPAKRGHPFDPSKYTDLGKLVAARLERLDMTLSDLVRQVKGVSKYDDLRAKSCSGGYGSSVLRGLKSIPEDDVAAWARALKLVPGTPEHDEFVLLADWQRLWVATGQVRGSAADRLLGMIRRLRSDLAASRLRAERVGRPANEGPETLGG